jgi:hypothetical protein
MDYLNFTDPNQGILLFEQWIPRARFGLHLRLSKLVSKINADLDNDGVDTSKLIKEYLLMTRLSIDSLTGLQQLRAYLDLLDLNKIKGALAFQQWGGELDEPPPYNYTGRTWAWWVHKLASRYGWTPKQIFSLWPEEAAAYLQEIIISEYDEADEARSLSEIAYHYDKQSKKATFRPVPRPAWMKEKANEQPKIRRIRRDMLPVGNIINLTHKTNDDFILN